MRKPPYVIMFFAVLILLTLLVVGCTDNSPTATRSVLVNYQVNGGFAGYKDRLTIYTDGSAELGRKNLERQFTLESGQIVHLKELLNEAGFPGLQEKYLNANGGADLITYVITYQTNGTKYTVTTEDGAVPGVLQPVLAELNKVISGNI